MAARRIEEIAMTNVRVFADLDALNAAPPLPLLT